MNIPCEFILHKFNTNEFSLRNRFWIFLNAFLKVRTEKILYAPQNFYDAIKWADMVVVSGGDILADYGEAAVKHYFFPIAVSIALGKPVYIFAQSISRYKDEKLARFCTKFFNKAALITVRERLSYDYLKELGVKSKLFQTADPAFTLEPCSTQRLEEIKNQEGIVKTGRPLIGISISQTVTRWGGGEHSKFVQEMANAIDCLAEKYPDSRFLFVPHVAYRNDPKNDDRVAGLEIFENTVHKDRVDFIKNEYNCEELKGLIGTCDVFVGARTHSTIASISQSVPTIALAYSMKAYGIMQDVLDREQSVLDIKEFFCDKFVGMVENLFLKRDEIIGTINDRLKNIRIQALRNGELAKKIFYPGET
jgi:polysaccharide pyruvyl transferase WcaK-like protein